MKKNFSVNIGGRIFNIDDDAYECLNSYLARLRNFFAADQGCEEIMADIEMRIAELLDQRKEQGQMIIALKNIEEVIAGMGEPDQLSDTETGQTNTGSGTKTRGKLFRDPDNRQIGGVAAGIGAWFGIDPVWVRLIFAAFTVFYAVGIIVYVVLWLILPVAQNTSEKLEMQRRSININTISSELASAGTGIRKTGNSLLHATGTFIRFVTEVVAQLFRWLFQAIGRLAGLVMLLVLFAMFIGIGAASLVRENMNMGNYELDTTTLIHALQWLMPGTAVRWLAYISLAMTLVAISGLMIYIGLRLLLKWPPLRWQIIIVFVLMLVAGIVTGIGTVIQYSRSTEQTASITKRQSIAMQQKHFHLASGPYEYHQYFTPLTGDTVPGNIKYVLGEIKLGIRPVPADSLFVTRILSATGWQENQAGDYAGNISHHLQLQDTLLTLNPYFMFPQADGMRYQKLDVIVGIPINTEVVIDRPLRWSTNYSDFVDNDSDGGKFVMTALGLKSIKPPVAEADTIQKAE